MSKTTYDEPKSAKGPLYYAYKVFQYVFLLILAAISVMPFVIMIVNSTRNTSQIESHAVSLIPSHYLLQNFKILGGKAFNPWVGFMNSVIVSAGATICTVYFSTMTAYAIVAYDWKLKKPFFTFIMCVLMIPAQVTSIGMYQFMYSIGMTNKLIALILPAIAAPSTVFFMRQYMYSSLPMEILQSARIDGAGEFRIFNQIALPMMKPAMATQAIFAFVSSWNNLFLPLILLTDKAKFTMPIMVSQLNGDIYKTEYGAVYLGLLLTVLPLFVIYFLLSKYIIAGVALGGVKE
ncbi:MAG: carbohydrate ABC transporter permease [Oscillospiraceae bacterium]|nr:carbohydrate ABC transporter permease [Oscillospiraceae bacterium]MCR4760121.1 carbohydrate ABC transporter permease [Oscillospiraceae bacterium]